MTLSLESSSLLACLRAQGRSRAADLVGVLPWLTAPGIAAILGRLARHGLVRVEPGTPARYEAIRPGEQRRIEWWAA